MFTKTTLTLALASLLITTPTAAQETGNVLFIEGSEKQFDVDLRGAHRLSELALEALSRDKHVEVGTITKVTGDVGAHWVVELRDRDGDGLTPRVAIRGVCWVYEDARRGGICHANLGQDARPRFSRQMLHEVLNARCSECRLSNYWMQLRHEQTHPFGPWWVVLGRMNDREMTRVTLLINAHTGDEVRIDGLEPPSWVLSANDVTLMGVPTR